MRSGRRNRPSPSVTATNVLPDCSLIAVTVTPGSTPPVESLMVPVTVASWARAMPDQARRMAIASTCGNRRFSTGDLLSPSLPPKGLAAEEEDESELNRYVEATCRWPCSAALYKPRGRRCQYKGGRWQVAGGRWQVAVRFAHAEVQLSRERPAGLRRQLGSRAAAALSPARRARAARCEVRMRSRTVRRVHRARGQDRDAVVHAAREPRGGTRHHDARRTGHARAAGCGAGGVHCRAGGAVRLLHERDDRGGEGAARADAEAERRSD